MPSTRFVAPNQVGIQRQSEFEADQQADVAQIRIGEPTLHKSSAELAFPTFFTTYMLGCRQIQLDRLG